MLTWNYVKEMVSGRAWVDIWAGFGLIAEIPVASGNAEIEKLFLNKPFEIFSDLDKAIEWAKELIWNE